MSAIPTRYRRDLTLREVRALLASIPEEHRDRIVLVSVEAGYVHEALTDAWEINANGSIVLHTTGDV